MRKEEAVPAVPGVGTQHGEGPVAHEGIPDAWPVGELVRRVCSRERAPAELRARAARLLAGGGQGGYPRAPPRGYPPAARAAASPTAP